MCAHLTIFHFVKFITPLRLRHHAFYLCVFLPQDGDVWTTQIKCRATVYMKDIASRSRNANNLILYTNFALSELFGIYVSVISSDGCSLIFVILINNMLKRDTQNSNVYIYKTKSA